MKILRNILAFLGGVAIGGLVNMTVLTLGSMLIPPPQGIDVSDVESISAGIHLFQPKHFIAPIAAHALGTFVGSLAAYLIAASHKVLCAYLVGIFTLIGGIAAAAMIPAPTWFIALDLVAAYVPMAALAVLVGRQIMSGRQQPAV